MKRLVPGRYDLGLLYRILSGRVRGRREFRQAVRVHARGAAVAEPLGFGERHRPFRYYESLIVYRRLSEGGRTLAEWQIEGWPREARGELVDALASFVADLHERGVFHMDLTPPNVFLARHSGGRLELFAVDLETTRIGAPTSAALSIRSLERMCEKFPGVGARERLRFLDRYRAGRPSLAIPHELFCSRIGAEATQP